MISERAKRLMKDVGEAAVWGQEANNIEVIPFSSPVLNYVSGCGGAPRGRVILLAGMPSAGKTMISLDLVKQVEKNGGSFLYFDAEFAYTPAWGQQLGIERDPSEWVIRENGIKPIFEMLIGRPETYGKAKEERGILYDETWIKDDKLQLVIIDSLDSCITPMQEASELGKQNMAPMPRFLSAELPRLVRAAADSNVTIVFILQVRTNIGVMYGNPETVSGGKALKHYASIFYHLAPRTGQNNPPILDEAENEIGHTVACRIDKNKVGPPHKSGDFQIMYDRGIVNQHIELIDLGIAEGVIQRPNNTSYIFKHDDFSLDARGRDNFVNLVKDNEEAIQMIRNALLAKGVKI